MGVFVINVVSKLWHSHCTCQALKHLHGALFDLTWLFLNGTALEYAYLSLLHNYLQPTAASMTDRLYASCASSLAS
jgi:hypothetical protein